MDQETTNEAKVAEGGSLPSPGQISLREAFTDAIRYWEPGRILYNIVLAAVVVVHLVSFLVAFRWVPFDFTVDDLLLLFVMVVLANLCYCSVYLPDVFFQLSAFREAWRRSRWLLLTCGIIFAAVLTRFEMLGFFHKLHP